MKARPASYSFPWGQYLQRLTKKLESPGMQTRLEVSLARLRFYAVFIMVDLTALVCGAIFEPESPLQIAARMQQWRFLHLLWEITPRGILAIFAPIVDPHYFRYMLPPIGAVLLVIIAASFYVNDIYNLPNIRLAFKYVLASLFGESYPRLAVDGGIRQTSGEEVNLLDAIGGPGHVLIQPGNAVMFRHWYRPSRSSVTRPYFMLPFEQIVSTINLDDQHGYADRVSATSRDGIQVAVRNIHFRYRILTRRENGIPLRRTMQNPYPFDETALHRMAYNLNIDENGQASWSSAVQRIIVGGITDFIASHSIDFLTAPGKQGVDPRVQLRRRLFSPAVFSRLSSIGTELLWVDFGHFDIVEDEVNQQRIGLWSTEWIGNANRARAFGEATRMAVHELGRAEANALLIVSIADALSEVSMEGDRGENLRRILLARTAQVLESWNDRNPQRSHD